VLLAKKLGILHHAFAFNVIFQINVDGFVRGEQMLRQCGFPHLAGTEQHDRRLGLQGFYQCLGQASFNHP
jgi:hypothetical protein